MWNWEAAKRRDQSVGLMPNGINKNENNNRSFQVDSVFQWFQYIFHITKIYLHKHLNKSLLHTEYENCQVSIRWNWVWEGVWIEIFQRLLPSHNLSKCNDIWVRIFIWVTKSSQLLCGINTTNLSPSLFQSPCLFFLCVCVHVFSVKLIN